MIKRSAMWDMIAVTVTHQGGWKIHKTVSASRPGGKLHSKPFLEVEYHWDFELPTGEKWGDSEFQV